MNKGSYWDGRLTRRRILATAGGGAAAIALAACGGSGNGGSKGVQGDKSGLLVRED